MPSNKSKEIKSDLFYKVKTKDGSPISYIRNGGKEKENRTCLYLRPGDWVNLEYEGSIIYEERKFLNYLFTFIIKRKSLFSLLFQASLLIGYFLIYALMIFQLDTEGAFDNAFSNVLFIYIFKDIILFFPLILMFYKMVKTGYRSFAIIGPARSLKLRFGKTDSMKFHDIKNKVRVIQFDSEGKILEDKSGEYFYRDANRVTKDIYKFDFLIVNKNAKELYKLEYYTIQLDFKQNEGLLITNGKKLEYSRVEIVK